MKEFISTLKQVFLVGWQDMLGFSLYSLFGGVVGILLTIIIITIDGSGESYAQVGALISLLIGMLVYLFAGIFSMANDFNLAISMGKTRKYYGPAKYLLFAFGFVIMMAASALIGMVEELLYPALYPGIVCEGAFGKILLQPMIIFGVTLIGAMLVMLFGALILRFSSRIYIFVWALWMFLTMSFSKLAASLHEEQPSVWGKIAKGVVSFVENATGLQLVLLVLSIAAVGLAVAFGFLRKQRVTS